MMRKNPSPETPGEGFFSVHRNRPMNRISVGATPASPAPGPPPRRSRGRASIPAATAMAFGHPGEAGLAPTGSSARSPRHLSAEAGQVLGAGVGGLLPARRLAVAGDVVP